MLYLNSQLLPVTLFPDKTSQVWKLPESQLDTDNIVKWTFSHEGEFLQLAQLKALLLQMGSVRDTLILTYLPYGRQDKQVSNTTTFALNVFAELLNVLAFDRVIIHDPHSSEALKLIANSVAVYPTEEVKDVVAMLDCEILCYPDKGALSKYIKIYNLPYMYGEKVRDQLTGNITHYSIMGDPAGKNVLIVDDICDGGATFKLLAKDLLAAGAKSVVLFVTHGIFSKGLQTLKDSGIQRIFCQDGECLEEPGSAWWTQRL